MAYEELCMYCFEDRQGQVICPHCGRDSRAAVPQIQMLPGTLVYRERFLVGRALGQDATGIVYSAYDTKRGNKLRLREYLPRDCAERLNDGSVVPIAGLEDQFEKGMKKLRASVEGVEDPRKRHFFFEENGTAYIAQRKSSAGAAAGAAAMRDDDDDDEDRRSGARQLGLIIGGAVALVVVAVIVIISLVNGALRNADDVVQNPTLGPVSTQNQWTPPETPTPTPYVSPTFAALKDPDQSWMDYTYTGNVNQEFDQQQSQVSKPTAKPTIRPEATKYSNTISNKSDPAQITALQQRLAALGWLNPNNITGSYDSATKQAVKDFQNYVNSAIRPSEKLTVDGIAGPKTLQWLYSLEAIKPTPTPTPAVTPDPNQKLTVDKNSPKNDIIAVQRKLIVLGLMNPGSDDGVYGTTTTAAVKKFQQRVNQLQGYNALEISGVVDPTTMAYLNYYVEWWESLQQATPSPEPVLPTTPQPTDAPTPVPTEIPDKPEEGNRVDANSPKESIAFVQEMLISVGLLPAGSNDGVYGASTTNAVIAFQEWVNSQVGFGTLSVTGVADQKTLEYLEYAFENGMSAKPTDAPTAVPTQVPTAVPTEAPTQVPTAVPTAVPTLEPTEAPTPAPTEIPDQGEDNYEVNPDSPKESIQYVQQMLIQAGLLGQGSDDGVYGKGTTAAVLKFQQYVNSIFGANTVPENGVADAVTLSYLEEFVDQGLTMPSDPTQAPATEAPAEPTQAPVAAQVHMEIGGTQVVNGVHALTGDRITFQWAANVPCEYYIYVYDANGDSFYSNEATDATQGMFGAAELQPGMIYTIQIGALPLEGDESQMAWTEARFGVPAAAPTEVPATEAPVETEPPAPQVGVIESLKLTVNGETADGVVTVKDSVSFHWGATGDVSHYAVQVIGNDGSTLVSWPETQATEGSFNVSQLKPGVVYKITVGAVPTNGGETVWKEAMFGVPAQETEPPVQETEPPVQETEPPKQPAVSAPVILVDGQEYVEGEAIVLANPTAVFSWMAQGEVKEYRIYLLNSAEQRLDLAPTTQTSTPVELSALPADTYRMFVGAVPTNAQSDADIAWSSITFIVPPTEG